MNRKITGMNFVLALIVSCYALVDLSNAQKVSTSGGDVATSVAVVIAGDGEGGAIAIAPAMVMQADGVLLVPYHVLKDAKEVQVRLKTGEIFDEVVLLGTDERRGVAAIRILASDLVINSPVNFEDLKAGESLTFVSHKPGSLWSFSTGEVTGVRLADEVPGAGQGFRVVQFKGVLGGGIEGATAFNAQGNAVGIVTKGNSASQHSGFIVPVSSLKALGKTEKTRSFENGKALQLPKSDAALMEARNPSKNPRDVLLLSKTVYVETNTTFFKEQQLINELNKRKEVKDWGWILTTGSYEARNKADLIIELDHQILTFDFTFAVRHRKTSIVVSAGKVTITGGASGAPKMTDRIIKSIGDVLSPPPVKK